MSHAKKTESRTRARRQPINLQAAIQGAQATVRNATRAISGLTSSRAVTRTHKSTTYPPSQTAENLPLNMDPTKDKNVCINLIGCHNVQIGLNNHMVVKSDTSPSQQYRLSSDSEDDDDSRDRERIDERLESALLDSQREVSQAELRNVAKHVGGSWRRLVRSLEIADADIEYTYSQNQSESLPEIIYQLLLQWKKNTEKATISVLASALKDSDLRHMYKYLHR